VIARNASRVENAGQSPIIAVDRAALARQIGANDALGRRELDTEFAAVASALQECPGSKKCGTIFNPCDSRLAGAHPGRSLNAIVV